MNPYREQMAEPAAVEPLSERDDEMAIVFVWVFLGCLLVAADIGQSEPWGVAFSLGMLVLLVAAGALWRHFMTRWRPWWNGDQVED